MPVPSAFPAHPAMPHRPQRAVMATALALTSGLLISVAHGATVADPSTEPLVQSVNLTYLGAFALDNSWPSGTNNTFQYGGAGLAYYNDPQYGPSLYVGGHVYCGSCVGEVQIPPVGSLVNSANWSSLPMARTIQAPTDITHGTLGSIMNGNNGNNNEIFGLLVGNGRILVGANNVYAVDGMVSAPGQIADIGVLAGTNIAGSKFSSWATVGGPQFTGAIRSQAGWMSWIPQEWQSVLGGDALTGQGAISITGSTSAGASANVISSASVGASNPVPGHTLIYYNVNVAPMCGKLHCEAAQSSEFNLTTVIGGMLWVPGTRTLLYVGGQGTGSYCYGSYTDCGSTDGWRQDVKGPHAPPYQDQVWAFDANDFVKVENGTLSPGAIQPYAWWPLSGMAVSPVGKTDGIVEGATIDPNTLRMYMTVDYGTNPRVEVWQITVSGVAANPDPPGNVTVQ